MKKLLTILCLINHIVAQEQEMTAVNTAPQERQAVIDLSHIQEEILQLRETVKELSTPWYKKPQTVLTVMGVTLVCVTLSAFVSKNVANETSSSTGTNTGNNAEIYQPSTSSSIAAQILSSFIPKNDKPYPLEECLWKATAYMGYYDNPHVYTKILPNILYKIILIPNQADRNKVIIINEEYNNVTCTFVNEVLYPTYSLSRVVACCNKGPNNKTKYFDRMYVYMFGSDTLCQADASNRSFCIRSF